jgi:aldose 1-epimerase
VPARSPVEEGTSESVSGTWHPMTGTEVVLTAGRYEAGIASVGASLRSFTLDGRDVVVPYSADELRPAFRGAVLAPWPNRVIDGRYTFDGAEERLPLTEPERGHALHGLLFWADWAVVSSDDASVLLRAELPASTGYPHRLEVETTYSLDDDGLRTTVRATNRGGTRAPYGTSAHPWLAPATADVPLDDWTLELPADTVELTDGPRLLPAGSAAIADTPFARFRSGDRMAGGVIDHAFGGLQREADGTAFVRVTAPDGFTATMRWGAELPWVQVCTGDDPDRPDLHRAGVAVEPMTCPPDAFTTGVDLIVLEPGAESTASWLLSATDGGS